MKRHFFVLAAVFISIQLPAQDSTGKLLDEAVITANKFPNKTSLTGKVVTIITGDQLERSGGRDLSQVLTEQAGIYIAGANSNAGKDKSLYLRGARAEHTLITLDGIPVYDPSGIGSNFDIRNLPLSNIERIEILKGSQSTLYGSDAIAGVINIITKKVDPEKTNLRVTAGYGSNSTFRGSSGIYGSSGKFDYNATYSIHKTRGINEAAGNATIPVTDRDGFTQNNIQLGAGYRPSAKIYLQPFFRYNHIRGDIDQGAFTDELDYIYTQESWQAGLRNELSIGRAKLNVLYSYNRINRLYTDDSVKSRNGFDSWSQGRYRGYEHFADAYLSIPLHPQLRLTGGIDHRSSGSDQFYSSIGTWGPYKSEYGSDSLHQTQWGVYAALNWNTSKGFNTEAGGRINFHSTYGKHAVFNINPSYLINNKIKLFANFSSAYRTPSLYQLFSEYGNRELKPELAITAETGLQYYSGNDRLTARAVVYLRNVKDVIFFYTDLSTFTSRYINQDKQKDHGFELEASWRLSKDIAVKGHYNYVTGKISTKVLGKDTVYNNLLRRPRSSFGFNISAQLKKNILVSSNLQFTGKRKDAYFDNQSFSTVNVTLASYLLWDIYAEYRIPGSRLKFFADCRNISNSGYTEIIGFNTQGVNGFAGLRFVF